MKNDDKNKIFDSKNQAPKEPYRPNKLYGRCEAFYTIWRKSPLTVIDHRKTCAEAKEHLEILAYSSDANIALEVYKTTPRIFGFGGKSRQKGALFQAEKLTPKEAADVIETFENRFC